MCNTFINPVAITTAYYDKISGILEVETADSHYLKGGDRVRLVGLHFTCTPAYSGVTTTIFPDHNRSLDIENIIDATKLNVQVGPSTITHHYLKGGEIYQHFDLNIGSGYRHPVSIAVTDLAFVHRFVRSATNSVTASTGGQFTPTKANYTSRTGVLILTIPNHGLTTSDTVQIADDGLIFTCDEDQFFTEQPYPRSTDPASGQNLTITTVTTDTITVNVGSGGGAGTGAAIEAVVGAGGTLALNVTNAGTGYKNPRIVIPEPVYENMEVVGVSRLGVGATTDTGRNVLMNLTIEQTTEKALGDRFFDAANLIEANTAFIADIAYGRMLAQFPSYTPPSGTNGQDL